MVFSCGMGAITTTLLTLLKAGDHVVRYVMLRLKMINNEALLCVISSHSLQLNCFYSDTSVTEVLANQSQVQTVTT